MRRVLNLVFVSLLVGGLSACAPEIPGGTFVCATSADCPPMLLCVAGRCSRTGAMDAGPCEPMDCTQLRAECGDIDDGCGTGLDCGTCIAPETCGGGGIPNICDCEATGCGDATCGLVDDGCGATLDCGTCNASEVCTDGTCECQPPECDGRCGTFPDSCGGSDVICDTCTGMETCGGGGVPNECGVGMCVPATCQPGMCDGLTDGCDGTINCGACTVELESCGAGDPPVENMCGCTPLTCGFYAPNPCGSPPDGCGGNLTCPTCELPEVCGGDPSAPDQCRCLDCSSSQCGTIPNGCMDCGACVGPSSCVENQCVCDRDAVEDMGDSIGMPYFAGDVVPGTYYDTWNIDEAGDEDWIRWTIPPSGGGTGDLSGTITVTLNAPSAMMDLSLEVLAPCLGVPGSVTCAQGVMITRGGISGCASRLPAGEPDIIELEYTCAVRSITVGVIPVDFDNTCEPYVLFIDDIGISLPG